MKSYIKVRCLLYYSYHFKSLDIGPGSIVSYDVRVHYEQSLVLK